MPAAAGGHGLVVIGCTYNWCDYYCVQPVTSTINGDLCQVEVDLGSWTEIKALFR